MAKTETEEVNLLDVLASFLAALKRNLLLSILLPLLGAALGLAIASQSNDLIESGLLIETSLLSENECEFLFDQLNKVGTIPGLTEEEQEKLAGFSFKVTRSPADNDLNEKSLFIQVIVRVTDQKIFPALEKAIVKVVNENPSVVRHRAERESFYLEMIASISKEIEQMDQVKKQISSNVQATYLNPADLYSNSVMLEKEKIKFEIRLKEIKSVHLIKGFDTLTIDARPSRLLATIGGFVIGFSLVCVILFAKFFAGYLKNYETSH